PAISPIMVVVVSPSVAVPVVLAFVPSVGHAAIAVLTVLVFTVVVVAILVFTVVLTAGARSPSVRHIGGREPDLGQVVEPEPGAGAGRILDAHVHPDGLLAAMGDLGDA